MAWRDSRSSRRRLILFSLAIIFGVGALVAIRSFGHNLEASIDEQSKTLVGADLVIGGRTAFTPEMEQLISSLGVRQAREVSFSSMAYFPVTEESRLVQVRGLKGEFPFYGEMETRPGDARDRLEEGHYALLEESILVQFDVKEGDEVRIGNQVFQVAGALRRTPGEMAAVGLLAPRVYIPYESLEATGLLQRGSLARYKAYVEFEAGTDVAAVLQTLRPQLRKFRLWTDTVERRKEELGRTMEHVQAFFQLVGLVALLLGSIGVASAVHVYVKRKVGTAAVLRCLGASSRQAFSIYLVQGMALGAIGAAAGAVVGVGLQMLFPAVLREFLPFEVALFISWPSVLEGFVAGFLICVVFALLPLLAVRRVSPLRAIRRGEEFEKDRRRDPLRWGVYGLIAAGVTGFAILQTGNIKLGLGISGGIGMAFLGLAGVAVSIVFLARRFFPRRWPYVWRQGLANLYRPENRTVLLMLAVGLGTFLVLTLYLTRGMLLQQVVMVGDGDRPTMVLFDIQDDQRAEVAELIQSMDLPVLQDIPIVTMRLAAVKGRSVYDIMRDEEKTVPDWVLRREYRSTYRSDLVNTEHVVEGEWIGRVAEAEGAVPVSVEQGVAGDLQIGVGDGLTFDVQGVPVEAVVASVREVDWQRVQPNFFVVFPEGVLEPAPKFHVLVTRTETDEESAMLQRAVVKRFSNISAIDLSMIIETLDSIMGKVAFVIRFMAMFTVLTGVIVLVCAVATSRYQRVQEAILLRTLGASRRQILQIMLVEYLFLGFFAGLTGTLLALGGAWGLAVFVFKIPFLPSPTAAGIAVGGTAAVTVIIGLASSRGLLDQPPLEVLRAEA